MDFNSTKPNSDNFTIHNNVVVPSGLTTADKLLLPFNREYFRNGLSQEISSAMDRIYNGEPVLNVIDGTMRRCQNREILLPTEQQRINMHEDEINTVTTLFPSIVNALVSFYQNGGNMDEMFFCQVAFHITVSNQEVVLGCQQTSKSQLMVLERKLRDPLINQNQQQPIPQFGSQQPQFLQPTPFQQAMMQQPHQPSPPIQLDQLRNRAYSQPTPLQPQPQMSLEEQHARRFETRRNTIVNNPQLQACLRHEINGIFNEIHNSNKDWRKFKSNIDLMLKMYNENKSENAHKREELVKALFQIFPTVKDLGEEGIKAFFGLFSQIFDGLCQFYGQQNSYQNRVQVMGDQRPETHFFVEKKDNSLVLTNQGQVLMVLEDVVRGPLPVQEVVQQFVPQQQYPSSASQYPQTGYPPNYQPQIQQNLPSGYPPNYPTGY